MKDEGKSKEKLIEELAAMRRQLADSEDLRRRVALLEAQVNASLDGILVVDSQGQKVLQNQRSVDLWKMPGDIAENSDDKEQIRFAASMAAHPQDLLDRIDYLYAHPYETSRDEIELKDGTVLDRYSSPAVGPDGTYYGRVWTVRDITERKRAEEKLLDSSIHLEAAADLARIAYWEYDGKTDEYIFNDAFYDLYGTTAEREGGYRMTREEHGRKFVHPDDLEELRRQVGKSRGAHPRSGGLEQYEHRAVRRDGEIVHILTQNRVIMDGEGHVLRIVGVNQDITARKKMEEVLRESETRLRAIFDGSRDAIAVTKDGIRIFANPALVSLFGCESADELIGKPVLDLVAPESRDFLEEWVEKRLRGEPVPSLYEEVALRKDGSKFLAEVSVSDYLLKGERFSCVILRDITDRKQAEAALRRSEAKFRAIVENSHDGILFLDARGVIIYQSPSFGRINGYTGGERIDHSAFEIVHPDDLEKTRRCLKQTLANPKTPLIVEYRIRHKDGRWIWVETTALNLLDNPDVGALVLVLKDITERRKAEEELGMVKHSIDVHYDGAFWLDSGNRFIYANNAACKALGYTYEELMGTAITDINQSATPERMRQAWAELRKGGSFISESVYRRKDGTEFPVEVTSTHVEFGGQEFMCGFARDLTEKKRLEEQLRQAQKMEAVGTLAGGIAHDFNNMLAIILGNAELALDDLTGMTAPSENIKQIVKASRRARDMTKQILTFSRKTERGRNPLRLRPLLEETYRLLRGTLPTTVRMELDIKTEFDTILADASQIQQVIVNLATNAAYAMREKGGLLTVGLDELIVTRDGQVAELPRGKYAKLSVQDTGTGMTEKVRHRVFEPFFTTKGPDEGTGMGLAVVYGIVKNHDGEITVESTPGKGSVFHLLLPLTEGEALADREETGKAPGGKEHILLVDDEADLLQMTARMFRALGYKVTTASGGNDAWEIFQENQVGFDLVMTDQVMPGLTGLDLARKILGVSRETPVIIVTGYSETVSPERAKAAGVREFVMKPLSKSEVAATVRRVLDGRETRGAAE